MKNISKKIFLSILKIISCTKLAFCYEASQCDQEDFDKWKICLIEHYEALDYNLNYDHIYNASYLSKVIELDAKQPEKKLDYKSYLKLINLPQKAKDANSYFHKNNQLLKKISHEYNISPSIIVSLLTLESNLGKRMGNIDITSSLTTLAFEGRRRNFFEAELFNLSKIYNTLPHQLKDFRGSWAGALGQCQFMPSSYLNFAIDYDGKGYADLWSNNADIYASVANYLKQSGWQDKTKDKAIDKIKVKVDYHAGKIKTYTVDKNFEILMKWNRSTYFGLAVLDLASRIKE